MTGPEFRAARLALGLNKHECARALRRAVRTIANYETTAPDPLAALVIGWMITGQCPLPKRKSRNVQTDRLVEG